MKCCKKCGETKPLDQFHRRARSLDGRQTWCAACFAKRDAERWGSIKADPQKLTEARGYFREYRNERYRSSAEVREKVRVRNKLTTAVVVGKVQRQPCEGCGNPRSEAHHDDYEKPLDVRWLCRACHERAHRANNQQAAG